MRRRRPAALVPYVMVAGLVGLLALLATWQYRWIGRVARAERQRMQINLEIAGRKFAEDFDREITRAFLHFQMPPVAALDAEAGLAARYRDWLEDAPFPELIGEVLLAGESEAGEPELRRLDPAAGAFAIVAWPDELERLRRRLEEERPSGAAFGRGFDRGLPPLLDEPPALVVRLATGGPSLGRLRPRLRARETGGVAILRLDEEYLATDLFPALDERHFGAAAERDYELAVVALSDPARVVFRSAGAAALDPAAADVRRELFALRRFPELRFFDRLPGAGPHGMFPGGRRGPRGLGGPAAGPGEAFGARWLLVVRHRAGSLEAAVAGVRKRNLGVGLGVLLLLGVSLALMAVSTRRERRLARQQLEFVAGVSHELHTPLAAIRSAAQNLADGVVSEPGQVRRYGQVIESQGRRLSGMVEKVMAFAGTESENRRWRLRPASLGEIAERAAADARRLFEERGCRLEVRLPPDLPEVQADPEALRTALGNLLENAAKYGAAGGRVELRAVSVTSGSRAEVAVTVEDSGPGIAADEVPRIFEPFYRGGSAAGEPGSGLGLSLVRRIAEAHGGRLTVGPGAEGRGAAFTLHLPAAPAGAATTREEATDEG